MDALRTLSHGVRSRSGVFLSSSCGESSLPIMPLDFTVATSNSFTASFLSSSTSAIGRFMATVCGAGFRFVVTLAVF